MASLFPGASVHLRACVSFFSIAVLLVTASTQADRSYMNEEWYDWHASADFAPADADLRSVEVHFVGPGSPTVRGIYVRGNADAPLDRIAIAALHDDRGQPVEAEPAAIDVPGMPDGKQWIRLGRAVFRRGYATLSLGTPAGCKFDYVCLSPNERYLTDGRAERWIRDHQKGKEVRCGMPLGGIGAGKIEIARDGWFRNISTNNNIETPFYHPDGCFLAAEIDGHPRVLRDEPAGSVQPVEKIGFEARYPIACLTFADRDWPVGIKLRAWSPIIPGNIEDSALPVAVFDFTLENPTQKPVKVKLTLMWENLIGSTGRPQPPSLWGETGHYLRVSESQGNKTQNADTDRIVGVLLTGGPKQEPDGEGNYTIATSAGKHRQIGLIFPGANDPPSGGISVEVEIPAGQAVTVPVVLTWYMDHFYQLGQMDLGHYYAKRFKDSREVAEYVLAQHDRLFSETAALAELFDRSSLPAWFKSMLLNDLYVLSTDTWLTRDGRFSVTEGATNMYGVMGTMDQKLYASHHLALLFPTLQAQELRQFGQLQNANGGITHDLGMSDFVEKNNAFDWPDLCSAFSLLSWQVYRYTGDQVFWDELRPKVVKALNCLATTWDPEGLGVPGRGSTFDDEDSYRIFSYTAGLWLCDLRLGMRIAQELGDAAMQEDYRRRFEKARALAMKELWTGTYFRYGSSPPPENKRTDASHFSQMAGEFWARILDFEGIYDASVRQKALAETLRLHWHAGFKLPPKIVLPDGRLFPRDDAHRNAPVSWPMHSRALLSGSAMLFGMEREGWDLLEAMHENIMAANGPDPWDQSLYYNPITGRHDWGVFYMSAPASWLAYQALIDTSYDVPSKTLTLRPTACAKVSPGRFPVLCPAFWGMGEVSPDGDHVSLLIERVLRTGLRMDALQLGPTCRSVSLHVAGRKETGSLNHGAFTLDQPVKLEPGLKIEARLKRKAPDDKDSAETPDSPK